MDETLNQNKQPEVPVEKPKTIEVEPNVLENILNKIQNLEKSNSEKEAQIEILRDSVGKYKLEQAESKVKPVGLPSAKLLVHDGKVVVAWKLTKNSTLYNPLTNVPYGEDIKVQYTYLDGTKSGELNYLEFIRNTERTEVVKVGGGTAIWTVEFVDKAISDKQFDIPVEYLNP